MSLPSTQSEPRERVLHVNDREVSRYVASQMLTRAGFEVVEAASGLGALEATARHQPSVILLDVQLPDIDGYEVCRRLKADPATCSIPVLLSSATFVTAGSRVEGLESGADGYLVQPFEASELVATLRALLRLRQAEQRANGAVALRDEFLQVAAHELKTPLTPILLKLQVLQRKLGVAEELPPLPELRGDVDGLVKQVRRLTVLVEGLLDVSRITAGKLRLDFEEMDLGELVQEVAHRFSEDAKRSNSPLTVEVASGLVGFWDRTRLEQVISNLLSNALKYGAGGKVHVRLERTAKGARISVRDEGIGIEASMLERVFGRFERGVSDRNFGGLGLGLFISRQIVEALGGRIGVVSEPKRGSEFTVDLPQTSMAQVAHAG